MYLFQCLFPTVTLLAKWACELFSMNMAGVIIRTSIRGRRILTSRTVVVVGLTSIQIFRTHLFLQMLFQASFVSEFTKTIWAFQWSIVTAMSGLHMIVQKPFFREIFTARHTYKRPFSSMDPVVYIQMTFSRISFGANCTNERFFASVHSNMFFQAVNERRM